MKISLRTAAVLVGASLVFSVACSSFDLNPAAQAQNLGQRVVNGRVLGADAAALKGATVFLRNTKNKSIRSYTSADEGRFRFAQVDMSVDYDLWAEMDGKKSPVKTISSFDSRKEVEAELKLK